MNILICDDQDPQGIQDKVSEANEEVGGDWIIKPPPTHDELGSWVKRLFSDVSALLDADDIKQDIATDFDGNDIILLDFGLTTLKDLGFRPTAEHLVGYLRAFSNTPYIVSLNELPNVDFDLKYLLGDFDTRADLALNTDHLGEPGLWTSQSNVGAFCPWYWPTLLRASARRQAQVQIVENHLDEPILETLGIPEAMVTSLSRQAIAFLSPRAEEAANSPKDVRKTSFWNHFRHSNRSLARDDRKALAEKFGGNLDAAACPPNNTLRTIVARVVAAELEFWFRRDLLGQQKLLIDAPHLQARYPFRTDGHQEDADAWSRTAREFSEAPYGLDPTFFARIPEEARYIDQSWIDRPAFWLPMIEAEPTIEELLEGHLRNTDLVFCEDTRRFRRRGSSTRFVTELGKGLDVRYVEEAPGKQYSPSSLFAR